MKVTLQSTDAITKVNGALVRIWEGETETGVRCYAAITTIAVHKDDDASEFERDLKEHEPPSIEALRVFGLRLVT